MLDFLWHISPALVGVTGGALLGGYLLQKFFVKRANEAKFIDLLLDALSQIQNDSIEYWSDDGVGKEGQKRKILLGCKIVGSIQACSADLKCYEERYRRKIDRVALMAEVSDACTGGNFQSAEVSTDPKRYLIVVNTIARVRSALLQQKL